MNKLETIKSVYQNYYNADTEYHYIVDDMKELLGDKDIYNDGVFLIFKSRELYDEVLKQYGIDSEVKISGAMIPTLYQGSKEYIPTVLICTEEWNVLSEYVRATIIKSFIIHECVHVEQYKSLGHDKFVGLCHDANNAGNDEYYSNTLEVEAISVQEEFLKRKLTPEQYESYVEVSGLYL